MSDLKNCLPFPGSSFHSLHFVLTSVSEPGQGLPQFIVVGYVDNQPFYRYDSNSSRVQSPVPWMKKADAQYWDTQTQIMQGKWAEFRADLETLRIRYNQSEGFHTLQKIYGCELRKDGSKGAYYQYGYDGRDFISFNVETLTWMAADVPAQHIKRTWETETNKAQFDKVNLEEECIEQLPKYLDYGKEALLRTEPPVGKVTRQAVGGGKEALICQAHGFYPKEIEATWRKGEEILEHETFRRNIAPNSDGTYYTWLSIEIDPKERDLYWCHLDHASLPKPLVLVFEDHNVNVRVFVRAILGVLAILLLVAGIAFFVRNQRARTPF
ncbi:major histocompatibility complex class I-related gene protein-like isoform X2 [Sceloporus undulatus]|uniref:major histocompatibility complex class I-related gene protein-like isoform X2 n=1 Tax=Sceloporus undulatus TaxID=8520 RepID=UPI001C4B3AE1|nr:major histocompatibility complex class I-related gene protein-like isoform X2 [Sceloporus undulatus]